MGFSWSKKHKSYTVKGYKKVKISLKDGTELFLGTQQPETLIENLKIA